MGNLHSVTSNKVVAVYFPLNLFYFLEGGGGGGGIAFMGRRYILH